MKEMNLRKGSLFLTICCLSLFFVIATSLYEDEVGTKEWTIWNVGEPKQVLFHPQKRVLYSSTHKNVLASLSLKNGDLGFRRVFQEKIEKIFHKGNVILVVLDEGRKVSLLDNSDEGSISWTSTVSSERFSTFEGAFLEDLNGDSVDDISLFFDNSQFFLSGKNGKLLNATQLQSNLQKSAELKEFNQNLSRFGQFSTSNLLKGKLISNFDLNGKETFVGFVDETNSNEIKVISLSTQEQEQKFLLEEKEVKERGGIKRIFLDVYSTKENQIGFRFLVVFVDSSTSLFVSSSKESGEGNKMKAIWTREESLSSISHSKLLDLPFIHVYDNFPNVPIQERLSSDQSGFHKLLIAVTTNSKLFGIHTESGKVIWSEYLKDCEEPKELIITRKSSHFPAESLLICQNQKKTKLIWFNPMNGRNQTTQSIDSSFQKVINVPLNAKEEEEIGGNHLILLADSKNEIHVLSREESKSEKFVSLFLQKKEGIYFHKSVNSSIEGYLPHQQLSSNRFSSQLAWNFPLDPKEKIVSASYSNWDNKIATAARILGNRDALEKYLNPNMFSIVSAINPQSEKSAQRSLNVYMIDGVTGILLHSVAIPGANPPVHSVLVENWMVFTYRGNKSNRQEVSVLELFEKKLDWEETSFSSFQREKPVVMQQTYVLPVGITSLGVTATSKGITPKQLLFGTNSDQILAINKQLLDPRRPSKEKITAEDREEGLFPYEPEILLNPRSILSHFLQLKNLANIQTSPSNLESTSVVLATGLDIHFTRTSPANSFDVLNPDFHFSALVVTSVTLLIATVASSFMAKKADLARVWK